MKTILIVATLFLFGQANAQCVRLFVKEHLSGSPICNLSSGDWIEICEQSNEVNGCPRNFYIFNKGSSSGSLTYELSLDRGWSTHYMTLMVNPSTKRFGFILQGQTAMYSYYTKNDMENKTSDSNNEYRRHRQWLQEKRELQIIANKLSDAEKYPIIDEALTSGNWELVTKTMDNLNYPKEYPKYREYNKLLLEKMKADDELLEMKIEACLEKELFNDAASLYSNFNYPKDITKLKIYNAILNHLNREQLIVPIKATDLEDFISKNKENEAFRHLKLGLNEIEIDSDGKVSINGSLTEMNGPIQYKSFGNKENFLIPVSARSNVEVSVQVKNIGPKYLSVSTDKKVFQRLDGEYYTGGFFKTSVLAPLSFEYNESISTQNNDEIPKNEIWLLQNNTNYYYVQNILFNESNEVEILEKKQFKSRIPTVLRRSLILTTVPFFTTLRIIENNKIP